MLSSENVVVVAEGAEVVGDVVAIAVGADVEVR